LICDKDNKIISYFNYYKIFFKQIYPHVNFPSLYIPKNQLRYSIKYKKAVDTLTYLGYNEIKKALRYKRRLSYENNLKNENEKLIPKDILQNRAINDYVNL